MSSKIYFLKADAGFELHRFFLSLQVHQKLLPLFLLTEKLTSPLFYSSVLRRQVHDNASCAHAFLKLPSLSNHYQQ